MNNVTVYKYADDTSFLVTEDDAEASLHTAIVKMSELNHWCFRNRIKLNESETAFLRSTSHLMKNSE